MKELVETTNLMRSENYKDRFLAEYWQLRIRYEKLLAMIRSWDEGKLTFTPTCPRDIYDRQLQSMFDYLSVLEERAKIENIDVEPYDEREEVSHEAKEGVLYEAKEKEILETKRLRKKLDEVLQEIKKLDKTRETSLSITKVQEAIMWLGMHLKELGTPNPYPTSKDNTDTTVHPTADNLKL